MSGIWAAVKATTSKRSSSRNRQLKLWKSRPAAPMMTTFVRRIGPPSCGEIMRVRARVAPPVRVGPASWVIPAHRLGLHPGRRHFQLDGAEVGRSGGVAGLVGDQILGAQLLLDGGVDPFEALGVLDEEAAPAGLLGDLFHLPLVHVFAEADRIDDDAGPAHVLQGVFETEAAPLVLAIGKQEEGALALDAGEGVEGEDERVVERRAALRLEAGEAA